MFRIFIVIVLVLLAALGAAALYTMWQTGKINARFKPDGVLIDVDGTKIHLTDSRPKGPEKATILLVHGASGNEAEMRLALGAQLLALHYRVISIDRPGMGWSDAVPEPASAAPDGQANLIRRALEKHGVSKAIVVVHSLAGAIGLRLALDHQKFVEGLLLISPVTHPWPGGIALHYTISASQWGGLFNNTLALPFGQLLMNTAVASVFAPQDPPQQYAETVKLPLVLRSEMFGNNARDVAGLYSFVARQSPRYKDIRAPVAIISGSADKIVLTNIHSRSSAREIPGATLNILPAVGHAPHWSHTAQVVTEVEKLHARTISSQEAAASPARKP